MHNFSSSLSRAELKNDFDAVKPTWRAPGRYQSIRSDAAIEEEIWLKILRHPDLNTRYTGNIRIEVDNGIVHLWGHVLEPRHIALMTNLASHTRGVVMAKAELTADTLLQEQIIRTLLNNASTCAYLFKVKCSFGWVQLGGLVPSDEIAKTAEGIVGFLPGVRGILGLPEVIGLPWPDPIEKEYPRLALQPRIASTVCQDGPANEPAAMGLVSQVVMDPCSRLVTALAVRNTCSHRTGQECYIPISAVEAANETNVWLKSEFLPGDCLPYPISQFPLPSANWRPPFPYQPGDVRWSLLPEKLE